jgi:DNA-binding protein
MTTKSGNLSLREKQRIEELIKCSRDRKRLHVVEVLEILRERIEAPFNIKIEALQRQSENIRIEREKAVADAGYGKIRERGCYDVHPDLDAFDAETNKILVELWKTSEPTVDQFTDEVGI